MRLRFKKSTAESLILGCSKVADVSALGRVYHLDLGVWRTFAGVAELGNIYQLRYGFRGLPYPPWKVRHLL